MKTWNFKKIKGIGFSNFKIFKEHTRIFFSPLTILTGKNNSGKSTTLLGLYLLSDFARSMKMQNYYSLGSFIKEFTWYFPVNYIRGGSFRNFQSRAVDQPLKSFALSTIYTMEGNNGLNELQYCFEPEPKFGLQCKIAELSLKIINEEEAFLIRITKEPFISIDIPLFYKIYLDFIRNLIIAKNEVLQKGELDADVDCQQVECKNPLVNKYLSDKGFAIYFETKCLDDESLHYATLESRIDGIKCNLSEHDDELFGKYTDPFFELKVNDIELYENIKEKISGYYGFDYGSCIHLFYSDYLNLVREYLNWDGNSVQSNLAMDNGGNFGIDRYINIMLGERDGMTCIMNFLRGFLETENNEFLSGITDLEILGKKVKSFEKALTGQDYEFFIRLIAPLLEGFDRKKNYKCYFKDFIEYHVKQLYNGLDDFPDVNFVPNSFEKSDNFSIDSSIQQLLRTKISSMESLESFEKIVNGKLSLLNSEYKIRLEYVSSNSSFLIKIISDDFIFDLLDMGLGFRRLISYVILASLEVSDIHTLEEPESNLHPAMQSKLAELFSKSMYNHSITIIETHSEYFIRKLQYLIARKRLDRNDLKIYYFNNVSMVDSSNNMCYEIEVMENGFLANSFGEGFLDEADNIAIELFKLDNSRKN